MGLFSGPDADLKQQLYILRSVQPSRNEDTLFLVGGIHQNSNEELPVIYQLVCDKTLASCKWEDTEMKMKYGRKGHVVLSIDESLAMKLCNQ